MDKSRKLSNEELGIIDGGRLFVSIDGGEKIDAEVRCVGGELNIVYHENGVKKRYNTGLDLSGTDIVGNAVFLTLFSVQRDDSTEYTYKIDTKG